LRVSNTCSSDVQFSREQIVEQLPSNSVGTRLPRGVDEASRNL
ncbi:hypothetical protein T05_2804, partial [Trichinella murrelli]